MGWLQRVLGQRDAARVEGRPSTIPNERDLDSERYEGMGQGARASAMRRDGIRLSELDTCYADEHDAEFVRGRHFLEWGDELRELKREGRLEDALALVLEIIEATERGQEAEARNAQVRARYFNRSPEEFRPRETPPGWTEHAAIILRKMGRLEDETAVIDRWIAHAGPQERWVGQAQPKLLERRAKAVALLEKRSA